MSPKRMNKYGKWIGAYLNHKRRELPKALKKAAEVDVQKQVIHYCNFNLYCGEYVVCENCSPDGISYYI